MNRFVTCTLAGLAVLALSASDSRAQGHHYSDGGHAHHHHRHWPRTHYHRHDYIRPGVYYPRQPWRVHSVRYLRVANYSGRDLTVYVRLNPDDQPWAYAIAAGQVTYLAVDGQPLATSAAYIWAASGDGREWNGYKDNALALVPAPYRSSGIGTYTFTFNP